jgi:hypothetical protein
MGNLSFAKFVLNERGVCLSVCRDFIGTEINSTQTLYGKNAWL